MPLRVPKSLLDDFDAVVARSGLTRTAAIERLMRRVVDPAPKVTPRPAAQRSRDVEPRFKR